MQLNSEVIELFKRIPFEQLIRDLFLYSTKEPWFFTEFSFLFVFGIFVFFYALIFDWNVIRKCYLVAFSLFFYYKSSGPFLALFITQVTFDYIFAHWIQKKDGFTKKLIGIIAILFSLSFLLYFKYANFFIENTNSLLLTHFELIDLFLPIGISFYTFQSISYLVDVYRGEIKASSNFLDYAFYMTFFPHLVAGPIVRASDFLGQVNHPNRPTALVFKESFVRIILGLIKKLFIADYLAKYVDMVFATPSFYSGGENLLGVLAYTFQIYFDFSGYSDIAIGLALLVGYRLKENFENPYNSTNITVFWRKWHISLSSWLRDYVYIPLGGNRKGEFNTYLFLLLTMLIGGFWHGASWKFVFWGFAHGLALGVHKLIKNYLPDHFLMKGIGWLSTFSFVSFCWIFFRANDFNAAIEIIQRIIYHTQWVDFSGFWFSRVEISLLILAVFIVVLIPLHWKKWSIERLYLIPAFFWIFFLLVALQLIIQFRDEVVQPFIYFQF
ncbi:MBOAT family O-acyltransferase [Aquirufa sp. A-Brett2-15D]|jgi:D-alanyl-lipoteichoic acid acyltransferase DltB (MBOAT superfamily)